MNIKINKRISSNLNKNNKPDIDIEGINIKYFYHKVTLSINLIP